MLGVMFSLLMLVIWVSDSIMVSGWMGVLVIMMVFVFWGGFDVSLSGGIGGDLMSGVLVMLSVWLTILMILASIFLGGGGLGGKEYLIVMSVLCLFLVLSFSLMDLMGFYLFFEGALIPIFLMVVGWGYQPERLMAGVYMLFYTLLASLPLLIGVMSLYWDSGGLGFSYLFLLGVELEGWWWVVVVMAFFVSAPIFFLHLWLPKAHVEAPVAGSMILAGVLLSLGGYGLLRFMSFVKLGVGMAGGFIVSLSLVGGLVASMICLCQVDLSSLIAYSSVGHMGMVLGGIIGMGFMGWRGALVLMVGHGLCSSGLFCMANLVYERMKSRSMGVVKGVMVMMPGYALWFFLLGVSNMAAPPSLGLFGEVLLFSGILKVWVGCMIVIMFLMFFAGAYSLWMYSYVVHGKGWFLGLFEGVFVREYLLVFGHWLPLNFLFIGLDYVSLWV